jgi:hypothetical protein
MPTELTNSLTFVDMKAVLPDYRRAISEYTKGCVNLNQFAV